MQVTIHDRRCRPFMADPRFKDRNRRSNCITKELFSDDHGRPTPERDFSGEEAVAVSLEYVQCRQ
jgi:hypothetical protein